MKPLGVYLSISNNPGEPLGIDDDHDWYLRRAAFERTTAAPTRRKRATAVGERLSALARLIRSRSAASSARRI